MVTTSPVGSSPLITPKMTEDDARKGRLNNDEGLPYDTSDLLTQEPAFYLSDQSYRARLGIGAKDLYSFALANDWIMWRTAFRALSTKEAAPNKSAETTTVGFNTGIDATLLPISMGQARFYIPFNLSLSGDQINRGANSLLRAKVNSVGFRVERVPLPVGNVNFGVKNTRTYNLHGTLEAVDALRSITGASQLSPDRLSTNIYEFYVEGQANGFLSLRGEQTALGIRTDKINRYTLGTLTTRGLDNKGNTDSLLMLSYGNMGTQRGVFNMTTSRVLYRLGDNGAIRGTLSGMDLFSGHMSIMLGASVDILKLQTPFGSFKVDISAFALWSRIGDNSQEIGSSSVESPDLSWDGLRMYNPAMGAETVTKTFGYTAPEMAVDSKTTFKLRIATNNGNGQNGVSFQDPDGNWMDGNADVVIKEVVIEDLTRDPAHRVLQGAGQELVGLKLKDLMAADGVECSIPVDTSRGKMRPSVSIMVSTFTGDFLTAPAQPVCRVKIIIDRN